MSTVIRLEVGNLDQCTKLYTRRQVHKLCMDRSNQQVKIDTFSGHSPAPQTDYDAGMSCRSSVTQDLSLSRGECSDSIREI